jgi:hypothetical protein
MYSRPIASRCILTLEALLLRAKTLLYISPFTCVHRHSLKATYIFRSAPPTRIPVNKSHHHMHHIQELSQNGVESLLCFKLGSETIHA